MTRMITSNIKNQSIKYNKMIPYTVQPGDRVFLIGFGFVFVFFVLFCFVFFANDVGEI